jgi:uncharacterized phage protein (TIGR01671 family)
MNNRELKFRVYIPDHEKFSYFRLGEFDYSDRYLYQHQYPVQQYTGLKDSKGVEIYEGDLVQYNQNSSYDRIDFEIIWSDTTLGWVLKSKTGDYLTNEMTPKGARYNFLEVVGNIFENKTNE